MPRKNAKRTALLFHPPVYDTQYWSEWSQPSGLLKVSSWLKDLGYHTGLFDCLATVEEHDIQKQILKVVRVCSTEELSLEEFRVRKSEKTGRGGVLRADERLKNCFGIPLDDAFDQLSSRVNPLFGKPFVPDEVWITSIMTYWWESTVDSVVMLKKLYPKALFRIGGIYPTLAPQHLKEKLASRGFEFIVIKGQALQINKRIVSSPDCIVTGEVPGASWKPLDFEVYEHPLWTHEDKPQIPTYCILTTSRGCPYDCSYCAQKAYNGGLLKVRRKPWQEVLEDIREKYHKYKIRDFAFYEDNFLMSRDNLIGLLNAIYQDPELNHLRLFAPEGFEVRLLANEGELLKLMKKCGFQNIYLPLENVHNAVIRGWNRNHTTLSMYNDAITLAEKAGYKLRDMDVNSFILFGMPGENLQQIMDTVLYASDRVGSVIPMLYSPVPGSQMYEDQKDYLHGERGYDLHHLNGKLFPYLEYNYEHSGITLRDYLDLESLMFRLNAKAKGESFHLSADNRVFQSLRTIFHDMEEGRAAILNTASKDDAKWMKRGADTPRECLGIA